MISEMGHPTYRDGASPAATGFDLQVILRRKLTGRGRRIWGQRKQQNMAQMPWGWGGKTVLLFLLDRAFVVSTLSQINYNCWLRLCPNVHLSNLSTLHCLQSSPCVKPPEDLLPGICASTLVSFMYSSLMSQIKVLQIHIQSHHPSLNLIAILGRLLPHGLCTYSFLCLDIHKAHSFLSLRSLLKYYLLGETFPAHPI